MNSVDDRCGALVILACESYDRVLDMAPEARVGIVDGISALASEVLGDPFGGDDVTAVLCLTGWLALALDECSRLGGGTKAEVLARVRLRAGSMDGW